MAHLKRNRYWYTSEREGGKVVSRYLGAGGAGELVATLEESRAGERQTHAKARRGERAADAETERAIATHGRMVHALLVEALKTAGYHQHKREWRKRR